MVMAALSNKSNGEVYNIPGKRITTSRKFLQEVAHQTRNKSKITTINSDLIFKIFGLFNPIVKELVEMLYLKREKFILDGQKFIDDIGTLPATDYSDGIKNTVHWAKEFYEL